MLIATTIIIWIIALALPSPKRYRRRQRRQATPETETAIPADYNNLLRLIRSMSADDEKQRQQAKKPDPDEIEYLQNLKQQLYTIAAEIDELPDGERKTRKQIAIDKQIFAVDKKLKRLYN